MRSYDLEKEFLNKSNCGSGIIYNKETELFDVTLDIKTDHLIKVTYDELVDLRDTSSLEPGVFYRITDYECTVYGYENSAKSANHRFDIIVLALSENILSEDARAIQHDWTEEEKELFSGEERHYFDDCNLSAWKLKYKLDVDLVNWAPASLNPSIKVWTGDSYDDYYRYYTSDRNGYYCWKSKYDRKIYTTSEIPNNKDIYYALNDYDELIPLGKYVYYNIKQYLFKHNGCWYYFTPGKPAEIADSSYLLDSDVYAGNKVLFCSGSANYIILEEAENIEYSEDTYTGFIICSNSLTYWRYSNGSSYTIDSKFKLYWNQKYGNWDYFYVNSSSSNESLRSNEDLVKGELYPIYWDWDSDDSYLHTDSKPEILAFGYDNYIQEYNDTKVHYKGVITYMKDEWDNECEYDFKNIMFTGRGTLFDSSLFYYTFVNLDLYSIIPAKYTGCGSSTHIILQPGTYTSLSNIVFKQNTSEDLYVLRGKLQGFYTDSDLYACICEDSEYIDEDTGEKKYKVEMYIYNNYAQSYVKLFEDREWYTLENVWESSLPASVYCKYLSGEKEGQIEEYSFFKGDRSSYWWDNTYIYKSWIWTGNRWGAYEFDVYAINLNYNNSSFDISSDYDSYSTDLSIGDSNSNNFSGCRFIGYTETDCYGFIYSADYSLYVVGIDTTYKITTSLPSINDYFISDRRTFSKPIIFDKPVYLYWVYDRINNIKTLVYSEKSELTLDDPVYLVSDLYADPYIVRTYTNSISDTTVKKECDCYRVSNIEKDARSKDLHFPFSIFHKVLNSIVSAKYSEFSDCYIINGKYINSSVKKTLTMYIDEFIGSNISDCYMIYGTRITSTKISKNYCGSFNQTDYSNFIANGNCVFTQIDSSNIKSCYSSTFINVDYTNFGGGTDIFMNNVHSCDVVNNNPQGDYYTSTPTNLTINGIYTKNIDITDFTSFKSPKEIKQDDHITIVV